MITGMGRPLSKFIQARDPIPIQYFSGRGIGYERTHTYPSFIRFRNGAIFDLISPVATADHFRAPSIVLVFSSPFVTGGFPFYGADVRFNLPSYVDRIPVPVRGAPV